MSSEDDLHEISDTEGVQSVLRSEDGALKRRKFARACDLCRRKKIRCDAHDQSNHRCSHCVQAKAECTFVEESKKRGPPKGYVEDLEARCKELELLLKAEAPHVDVDARAGPSFTQESWLAMYGSGRRRPTRPPGGLLSATSPTRTQIPGLLPVARPQASTMPTPSSTQHRSLDADSDSDEQIYSALPAHDGPWSEHLHGSLNTTEGLHKRFHGKSSGVNLVQTAMSLKQSVTGAPAPNAQRPMKIRPKFWSPNPWERIPSMAYTLETFVFPPDDLVDSLVECTWARFCSMLPVIHRPSFERDWRAGRHKRDVEFARLFLMVCAVGSKGVRDPRVCFTSSDGQPEWASAGWFYFAQVMSKQRPVLIPVGLTDLQVTTLAALYLASSSAPHAGWLLAGIGLRFAQDIGAHREKVYGPNRPFENQMWRRVFWSLVLIDRMSSTRLGRSSAINEEDMDVQLPLEVDDEHWDEVKKEWKQPKDEHPQMAGFVQSLKLQSILAYTLRTVYAINSSKIPLGFTDPDWEARTIAELDSSLNAWSDNLPEFLRWDPNMKDGVLRQQASTLRLTYLYVQITVHRKFIPILSRGKPSSSLSFPSLAICTNAARATSHVLEAELQVGLYGSPLAHITAFTAGTVLLLGIWDAKRRNLRIDTARQMEDVNRCLKVLKATENTWHSAGRLGDILSELAVVNDPTLNQVSSENVRKRTRDMEDLHNATARATIADPDVISPADYTSEASMSPPPQSQPPLVSPPQPPPAFPLRPAQLQHSLNAPQQSIPPMYHIGGGMPFAPLDFNSSLPLAAWDVYPSAGHTPVTGISTTDPWPPQPMIPSNEPSPGTMFQGLLDILNQPVDPSPADTMPDIASTNTWLDMLAAQANNSIF